MGTIGDRAQSSGDVMRRLHELERRVQEMQAGRRLEHATIGAGGIRVRGGAIVIVDEQGDEAARLSTDGLTLEGLLTVLGSISARGGGRIQYFDDADNRLVYIGDLFQQGEPVGPGMFVNQPDGSRLMTLTAQGGWRSPRLPISYGFRTSSIPDGSFVELARGRCLKRASHVRVRVTALLVASNAAEVRLTEVFSGTTVGTVTISSSGPDLIEGPNPRDFGQDCLFIVEARRSAGSATNNVAYVDAFEQLVL